jgi:diketogulonate reductase-like aldo/keto reductase
MASAASSTSSSAAVTPEVTLSNGVKIPTVAFGLAFGQWTGGASFQGLTPELAWQAIPFALEAGFRHFDGAHVYGTERHLGDSLAAQFRSGALKRADLFITTKLAHPAAAPHLYLSPTRTWNPRDVPATDAAIRERLLTDFSRTLDDLGVGYVDLLLMHWPGAYDEKEKKFAQENRVRVWKVFEELYSKGVVRAIGVSNFTREHLEHLTQHAKVAPMVIQNELHPYCQDTDLVQYCKSKGMVVEAYAPFASGSFGMLQDPVLLNIATQVKRSVGQVVLRWHAQHGHVVLPKSSNLQRAKENISIFDFSLSTEQMSAIDALHPKGAAARRTCPDPSTIA